MLNLCVSDENPRPSFVDLLHKQIRSEFTASQQYIALAVWLQAQHLLILARKFFAQAAEERQHAMKIIRFMLDRGFDVVVPGIDDVRNDFDDVVQVIELALDQERQVTEQIKEIARAARRDDDPIGEHFISWFLEEQVEEIATMTTLLAIATRAGDNVFLIEEYLDRIRGDATSIEDDEIPTLQE